MTERGVGSHFVAQMPCCWSANHTPLAQSSSWACNSLFLLPGSFLILTSRLEACYQQHGEGPQLLQAHHQGSRQQYGNCLLFTFLFTSLTPVGFQLATVGFPACAHGFQPAPGGPFPTACVLLLCTSVLEMETALQGLLNQPLHLLYPTPCDLSLYIYPSIYLPICHLSLSY